MRRTASSSLTSIVRRVLMEDTAAQAVGLSVYGPSSGSIMTRRDDAVEGEQEGAVDTSNMEPTSFKLLGNAKPNWGGGYATGAEGHRKRPFGNWESDNAWDVFASPGTSVYSLTQGTVSMIRRATPGANVKVYGDMVIIKGAAGNADMYYTHIDSAVKKGAQVNPGDLIGVILNPQSAGSSAEMPPHVHIGMNDGSYVANKADPKRSSGGGNISKYVREDGTILRAAQQQQAVASAASAQGNEQKKGEEKKPA
jgi:murein DD-endopeptidase MepM/ murein hydrolase activator NlpD